MLKEISSAAFRTYENKIRDPIVFNNGLNVVLGSNDGTNSIGKSTFLMVIDFAFGGDDYVEKCIDVQKNVLTHIINFKFEFNKHEYFFSRSTSRYRYVEICDSAYHPQETISIRSYREKLLLFYGVEYKNLSFRSMVSPYSRIYQRQNLDEKRPLEVAKKGSDEDAVITLLKLFGRYEGVTEIKLAEKESKEKQDIYKKSIKYELIPKVNNKQYENNNERIKFLESRLNVISKASGTDQLSIIGVSPDRTIEIEGLKDSILELRRKLSKYKSEYRAIVNNVSDEYVEFDDDIKMLSVYFPNADIRKISEIEEFHKSLQDILFSEIENAKQDLHSIIAETEQEKAKYQKRLESITTSENIAEKLISTYAEIKSELDRLKEANNAHQKVASYGRDVKVYEERSLMMVEKELTEIEFAINCKMKELNEYIYSDKRQSPLLQFSDSSKNYTFETPDDSGTGTSCKSLILFDLSILSLSILPILIHDSVIHKQIEDHAFGKIIDLYQNSGKQIFIAMDRQDTFSEEINDKLENACVLHLSGNGNELFGRSWNLNK